MSSRNTSPIDGSLPPKRQPPIPPKRTSPDDKKIANLRERAIPSEEEAKSPQPTRGLLPKRPLKKPPMPPGPTGSDGTRTPGDREADKVATRILRPARPTRSPPPTPKPKDSSPKPSVPGKPMDRTIALFEESAEKATGDREALLILLRSVAKIRGESAELLKEYPEQEVKLKKLEQKLLADVQKAPDTTDALNRAGITTTTRRKPDATKDIDIGSSDRSWFNRKK